MPAAPCLLIAYVVFMAICYFLSAFSFIIGKLQKDKHKAVYSKIQIWSVCINSNSLPGMSGKYTGFSARRFFFVYMDYIQSYRGVRLGDHW